MQINPQGTAGFPRGRQLFRLAAVRAYPAVYPPTGWHYLWMRGDSPRVQARFAQVNVVISDMERSLAFYRLLGVEVEDMPEPWSAHHRTVTNVDDDVTIELDSSVSVPNWASEWGESRTGVVIGFVVDSDDDVDAAVRLVEGEGHRVLQQPHNVFFGARYAVVEDPDGIAVGIMGPIDDARRWMPDLPE